MTRGTGSAGWGRGRVGRRLRRGLPRALAATAALALLSAVAARPASTQEFDLLIRGGMVLDGSGSPAFRADVGIVGDEIAAMGSLTNATARRVIDAAGMMVSPGFIDMHSHADRSLVSEERGPREARNLVLQGITTVVVGPDGRNPAWPLEDEIAAYEGLGTALNVVPMVGHGTVRSEVMGADYERPATEDEIRRMAELVREGMEAGAWGLGAGPEYRPGRFSTTEELIALARVVADYDGFYYAHQRSQSPLPLWQTPSILAETDPPPTWPRGWRLTATDGMKETIRIGREAGIRVVGSHIKAKGPTMWGHSAVDVRLIEQARSEGVQVYLDQYPYETFGGGATGVLPPWAYAPPHTDRTGGTDDPRWGRLLEGADTKANLRANLADPAMLRILQQDVQHILDLQGGADRHIVVLAPRNPELVGKTLAEVAAERGQSVFEALVDFALTADPDLRGGVRFRPVAGHREDVDRYMRQEYTATATDGGVVPDPGPGRHPRYYGTYPRKIAHYVRERGVITLPFMVRSSTGLPAQITGLTDRGYIRTGQKADLVVFDYERVQDRATIMDPGAEPEGMEFVMVNGVLTVDGGRATGALPGVVLRKGGAPVS